MIEEENVVIEAKYLDNPEIFSDSDKSCFYHLQDAILLKFNTVMNALLAKKRCNHLSFYGLLLHVQYAPQFETLDDTREKYLFRIQRVHQALNKPAKIKDEEVEKEEIKRVEKIIKSG